MATATTLALAPMLDAADTTSADERVLDIHQHTNYSGRTDEQLRSHQRAMGVTHTILLPAGRWFGLDAQCGGNQSVQRLARRFPREFSYFANEVAYLPEAPAEVTGFLRQGACGIGEQKFTVAADSAWIQRLAELAREFRVPMLMHFQFERYNTGIENFHRVLARNPQVNFIGHAQTWWANIDAKCDQKTLYPVGPVTPGGINDRLLREHRNMFGDLSAGSGLNSLIRDEDHTRGFLERHQDQLLFGSDCNDLVGRGPGCQGAQILAAIRRLAPNQAVERKILYGNARKLLGLRLA